MSRVFPLTHEQRPAVEPSEVVWLSASAGTGKTQVLSARVLRLLLEPAVQPDQILCLTFTKAGATEMAARINEVLARWVRLDATTLAKELLAIGADHGPDTVARARKLFAAVLDCPGGGLRIDTIHAFAQWLLAAFPNEAGLLPGVKAMEDRDKDLLLREVLADLLLVAERTNDAPTLDALARLSVRMGPEKVPAWLLRCAAAREAWEGPGGWQPPMKDGVHRLLGLPADAGPGDLLYLCSNGVFDTEALECCLSAYSAWSAATGTKVSALIRDWLESGPTERLAGLDALHKELFGKEGQIKNLKSLVKLESGIEEAAFAVFDSSMAVQERRALLELVDFLVPALEVGRKFALAWEAAKARAGFIDFDDQIRQAAQLLTRNDLSEWIRYKLDRQFDHILVDEAQDTNAAQWQIIGALTDEFFAGQGARDDKLRTLFVVGDYKQAIFRFQGTSPENFAKAKARVDDMMRDAAANLAEQRSGGAGRTLQDLDLGQSFRTARAILEFVDQAIGLVGHEGLGLATPPEPHVGQERPGQVTLWRVIGGESSDGEEGEAADEGAEGWLSRGDRQMAERIARQVRDWLDHGFPLVKGEAEGKARRATAGDVMVLVRKRKELAGLIVARLHAAGVPVAGVDRLRLATPLAVRDLMAALRFAVQPGDDLNLACLLVSPLLGWSQDDLLRWGWRPEGVGLYEHLRKSRGQPEVDRVWHQLGDLLRIADFEPPRALLHWILTGPWQGRKRLVARLGTEANDPIDELLSAAGAYAANEVPSLTGFIRWFDAGTSELKREAGKSRDEVRVMTVHGSKGLQAPIVILADAADNPARSRGSPVELEDPASGKTIPLPGLPQSQQLGRIADVITANAKAEMEEHWRLLYVAMTRAEEALFIGGALTAREKAPHADSWYARLAGLFDEADWVEDARWGATVTYGDAPAIAAPPKPGDGGELPLLPAWLERPVAAEPRPPRPLAPSSLGEDLATDPPFPPGAGQAAARGVLLHKLLERLPELPVPDRKAAAEAWLARNGGDFTAPERADMVRSALTVLAEPAWADLFAPGALAEVPIAATVGGQVVVGTIDRMVVLPDRIRLVDFKTARRPPESLDAVPVSILRQMAAYAAALEAAYPGRTVEAALLYTQAPRLLALPDDLLAVHKQALLAAQESF
ncbi:double-strand break repair helicase AddA [Novosphingobium ginsenosidimutans]|uniref:DNA 3'-5' helicase n=1 Tax=Novosphingobium ginsenosidimutans TaxID=1176536 RepID=A0A5B8S6B7_9SPHN|nr:double-strand break repair helicase AddA [Novosphingobium ginsenosidimutans]QEA16724.1 double-strand break repair helicase AddA [Novosphingobium ginsenosidimutans]